MRVDSGRRKRMPEDRFKRLRSMTEEPKNPQEGDVYFNPILDHFFVYVEPSVGADWDHGWVQVGIDASANGNLDAIEEAHRSTRRALEVLIEAVALSHDKGRDGRCKKGCPGCEVEARATDVMVARRIME